MNSRYLGGLFMALAASIWGGMYVVSKIVLVYVSPLLLVWVRYDVALLVLVVAIIATKQSWRIRAKDVPLIVGIGLIGYVVSIWAQFFGTQLSTAQLGAMITSATPAFMVIFGRVLLGEKITLKRALSVLMATSGVVMVIGLAGVGGSYQLGGLVLFLAALTWALMSVLVKRIPKDYSQLVVTTYAILIATVVITPKALYQMHGLSRVWSHSTVWGGVLYLGIVSTAGAFYLWNKGLQMVDASTGGIYFFFQPLVGTFLGWAILSEQIQTSFWIGAALIIGAVALVMGNSSRA